MYIEYVAHANNHRGNQIVENSWWALARMHVGKTRSTNGTLCRRMSVNRIEWRKINNEATSIMLTYHSQRQKRTMRSFKNKTSNAWVAYQEGTVLITFESRKKTRFTWHWSQKSLIMNSLFKNQHHSYCLTHLCRPKFMLTRDRLEQRPSGAYMLSWNTLFAKQTKERC